FVNLKRIDSGNRNVDGQVSGYRVRGLRRVYEQLTLALRNTLDIDLPIRRANHTRQIGQCRFEFLFGERQVADFSAAQLGRRSSLLRGNRGGLLPDFYTLVQYDLGGQYYLEVRRGSVRHFQHTL